MIGRRAFLTGAGAGAAAVVVGFDPLGGGWVTRAEAAARPERFSFARVPELDGELALDAASRDAVTTDLGNIVHQRPRAVLRPGSVRDVSRMVRFCREHRVTVAPRGQAHTTYGQGLADGLVIEMRSLRRIHSLTADRAEVDAGIHWMELAKAAFARTPRRTPPVLTGYTQLTVGGTLSVGGIGGIVGGLDSGLQVDHVRELEVVTGTGEVVRCSRRRRSDLFDAVLGGLGQCGIITKAVLDLIPARERARTYLLGYDDNALFFRDLRTLIERPGIDHVYAEFTSSGTSPTYTIHATVFHEPAAPPKDGPLLAGVSATPQIQDTGYLEYVFSIDTLIDEVRATQGWDRLVKPWFDVWLPGETVERYLGDVLKTLTPKDIGPLGAGLLYPQRRSEKGRPLPRVPEAGASPWMFVIDINTVAEGPDVDPGYVAEMLARNERLYARTRDEYGGTLYPIGSVPMTARDWRAHFGDAWPKLRAAKRRYDPDGVLTPGQGVFGHRD